MNKLITVFAVAGLCFLASGCKQATSQETSTITISIPSHWPPDGASVTPQSTSDSALGVSSKDVLGYAFQNEVRISVPESVSFDSADFIYEGEEFYLFYDSVLCRYVAESERSMESLMLAECDNGSSAGDFVTVRYNFGLLTENTMADLTASVTLRVFPESSTEPIPIHLTLTE